MVSLYCANCANTIGPTQIQISTVDLSLSNTKSSNSTPSLGQPRGQTASCSLSYCVTTPLSLCKYNRTSDKYKCTTAQIHISVSGSILDLCCIVPLLLCRHKIAQMSHSSNCCQLINQFAILLLLVDLGN